MGRAPGRVPQSVYFGSRTLSFSRPSPRARRGIAGTPRLHGAASHETKGRWDQGAEMAQHAQLRIDTGLHVFFCDPRSPWQRGHEREHQRPAAPVLPQRD